MKKTLLPLIITLLPLVTSGQYKWFESFTDSLRLAEEANRITGYFTKDLRQISQNLNLKVNTVINTTPYLIYIQDKTVNIPFWPEVAPELKGFLTTVAGSEEDGRAVFALFFNGFYLPHELGHGLQEMTEPLKGPSYDSEYFANIIAMLWWRKQGKSKELKDCYTYAVKMSARLKNPVPQGQSIQAFFTENYAAATKDPFVYGFMQFRQFTEIYEDKTLPDFDTFVKDHLKKVKK